MIAHSLKPDFGQNYDLGYAGFTCHSDDLVGTGIAWFERWDVESPGSRLNVPTGICVTHALIVSGPDECVEAHAGTGVAKSSLSKYFNDPHCQIFFRKPRNYSQRLGEDIVISAQRHIGDKYGYGVIVADALASTFFGHWLNDKLNNWPNRCVSKILDRAGTEVCSELAAKALQDNLPHFGCLEKPARMITPQELFEDGCIFDPWKNTSPVTTLNEPG